MKELTEADITKMIRPTTPQENRANGFAHFMAGDEKAARSIAGDENVDLWLKMELDRG